MIDETAAWTKEEIKKFRQYLRHINGEVIEVLAPLSFDQKVGILEGLWTKLGKSFIEQHLETPAGVSVIRNLVAGIEEMAARGKAPKNLKGLISDTTILDKHLAGFL